MAARHNPPFRAEHIGSLLRPEALKTARAAFDADKLPLDELRRIEDAHIIDAIKLQEEVGLKSISDGEFRRLIYFGHFPEAVSGFTQMTSELDFKDADGKPMKYTTPVVTGKIKRERGISTGEYAFLKSHTKETPKVTLPSPCSQHYFRWRDGISDKAYPDIEEFFTDIATVYQEEIAELASMGAVNIQLDDVSLPLLCDARQREQFKARGYDPDEWVDTYIAMNNKGLAGRPAHVAVGVHLCRGTNQGKWLGEGGYDYVAERMFNDLDVDYLCMEYDSPRAGSFEPLRFMPKSKTVVLGLISSKNPAMEDPDDIKRRIDEAARFMPLENLALSPQCGFASTAPGNPITPDIQRAKLELAVAIARDVWGDI
jgi:5-methyltetrahydropteroyltriglutamate--homocysteine methyltransferase